MGDQLAILITSSAYATEAIGAEIRSIAPGAAVFSPDDLARDPSLIERVDVVFGRLGGDAWGRAGRLKWIHTTAAGADWAQREPARSHPAVVTNSPIHAEPMAEHLFGMLLMLVRGLHTACRGQLARRWDKSAGAGIDVLPGKRLCVVALGTIGRRCVELGRAFGMSVIGVRRRPQPTDGVEEVYAPADMPQAFSRSDVIMVVLPGTAETRGIIGRRELAAVKRGAYLLNAGRGKTVDTDALVEALESGVLGGAGLDVVDPEPLPSDHPLWTMPNVIITPHTGGIHADYVANAAGVFLENLRRFVASEPLLSVVDKQLGY